MQSSDILMSSFCLGTKNTVKLRSSMVDDPKTLNPSLRLMDDQSFLLIPPF